MSETENNRKSGKSTDSPHRPDWIEVVEERVKSLQFGSVQIVIHNSKVVEIDVVEKARFDHHPRSEQ